MNSDHSVTYIQDRDDQEARTVMHIEEARVLALHIRTACAAIAKKTDPETAAFLSLVVVSADQLACVLEDAAPSISP
jgi:hypothetical protein